MRERIGLAIFTLVSYLIIGTIFQANSGLYETNGEKIMIISLITIACLCMVYEMFTKGFGFVGLIGFLSLGAFFFIQLTTGNASVESLVIFVIGILLIILECFIPGAIAGIIGFIAFVWGFIGAVNDVSLAFLALTTAFVSSGILFYFMKKILKKDVLFYQSFVLKDKATAEKGYVTHINRTDLIGKKGKSLTMLRPAGTALIDDERLDVVTVGDFIEQGKNIEVVQVEGVRIVVKEVV